MVSKPIKLLDINLNHYTNTILGTLIGTLTITPNWKANKIYYFRDCPTGQRKNHKNGHNPKSQIFFFKKKSQC